MDLVEIQNNKYLADCGSGIYFDNWFIYDWPKHLFSHIKNDRSNFPLKRTCFTAGDDHIELYDCVFVQEPCTFIDPKIGGRLATLVMHAKFTVKDTKVKGKMCIRNPKRTRLVTEFELELKVAEILQTVGFIICGDSLIHNVCLYEFSNFDVSLTYHCGSEIVSILDRETDVSKRKLLEMHLVEILLQDLCPLIREHEIQQLSIKQTVSELCGNCYESRNLLRKHNRISHAAMKNLANHIINLTNDLVEKSSKKLYLPRIYGLSGEKNLKAYKAYISTLHTLAFEQMSNGDEEVIISKQDDCTIIYVPVKIWEIGLYYKEIEGDSNGSDDEFKKKQIFTTEGVHFKLSLRKNEEGQAEFKLLQFKILNIKPLGSDHPVEMTMDHLVSFAIEEYMKPVMEQTFKDKKLQELAIKPNVQVEDDGDNLYEPDDSDQYESD